MNEVINIFCGECENCKKLMLYKQVLKGHTEKKDLENINRAKQVATAYMNNRAKVYLKTKVLIVEEAIEVPKFEPIARPKKIIDKKYSFYDLTDIQIGEVCAVRAQEFKKLEKQRSEGIKLFVIQK